MEILLDEPINEERCGAYAESWKEIGKPKGWLGCSLPKGHEGDHMDTKEVAGMVDAKLKVYEDAWKELRNEVLDKKTGWGKEELKKQMDKLLMECMEAYL